MVSSSRASTQRTRSASEAPESGKEATISTRPFPAVPAESSGKPVRGRARRSRCLLLDRHRRRQLLGWGLGRRRRGGRRALLPLREHAIRSRAVTRLAQKLARGGALVLAFELELADEEVAGRAGL